MSGGETGVADAATADCGAPTSLSIRWRVEASALAPQGSAGGEHAAGRPMLQELLRTAATHRVGALLAADVVPGKDAPVRSDVEAWRGCKAWRSCLAQLASMGKRPAEGAADKENSGTGVGCGQRVGAEDGGAGHQGLCEAVLDGG
jgi:hypothetical protein